VSRYRERRDFTLFVRQRWNFQLLGVFEFQFWGLLERNSLIFQLPDFHVLRTPTGSAYFARVGGVPGLIAGGGETGGWGGAKTGAADASAGLAATGDWLIRATAISIIIGEQ
jgi:hypothetical protein